MTTKCLAATCTIFSLLALPALAQDLPATSPQAQEMMKVYFANTRVCKAPGKFECHTWFNPDGTFMRFSWDSRPNAGPLSGLVGQNGKWWVRDDAGVLKLCRQFEGQERASCDVEPGKKIGDKWQEDHTQGALAGITEYFEVVAGRR